MKIDVKLCSTLTKDSAPVRNKCETSCSHSNVLIHTDEVHSLPLHALWDLLSDSFVDDTHLKEQLCANPDLIA